MMGNNITKTAKSAFTLAEMMVVLLIMSIILAAMAPVMTTRMSSEKSSENTSPWRWVESRKNLDAYLRGNLDNQRAIIGDNTIATDGTENARLIIKTSDSVKIPIMFKDKDDNRFELKISNNIIGLGKNVLSKTNSGVYSLAIGNEALATNIGYPQNVALGHFAAQNVSSSNNIAIGYQALQGSAPSADSTATSTGSNNIAIGSAALVSNSTGNNNIAIGDRSLYSSTSGYYNTAVGHSALYSNTIGSNNSAFGFLALNSNTTGSGNIALGNQTLKSNTTGSNNSALGYFALNSNKTGYYNTAIGYQTLSKNDHDSSVKNSGYWNTAVGHQALQENTLGSHNTAIGTQAMWDNTTGSFNTALGVGALYRNKTGTNNVALGFGALSQIVLGDSNTAVGQGALGNLKDNDKDYSNWNTAVGSYSLSSLTKGYGNIAVGVGACGKLTYGVYTICIGDNSGPAEGSAAATDGKRRLYIGDFITAERNDVIDFRNLTDITLNGVSYRSTSSDRRLKNIGKEYTSSLDKIRRIKPFNFTFKKDKNKTPHVGVIAQDLQKIFPDAVQKDSNGYLTIRQEDMFYAVINAIKELDAKIMQLIETLKQVQRDIYALRQENSEIKKRLDALEKK